VLAGLAAQPDLARMGNDPSAIDSVCFLSRACDAAQVPDAALAATALDEDPLIAAVAGLLLRERTARRDAGAVDFMSTAGVGSDTFASLDDALNAVRSRGIGTVEVPRSFLESTGDIKAGVRLAPIGAVEDCLPPCVVFDEGLAMPVALPAFARALGLSASALDGGLVHVAHSLYDAVAERLVGPTHARKAYAWPEKEGAAQIVAPKMTFSASRLNTYVSCPRRWFFEYLCAALADAATVHAVYGKAFHAALEALHREVRKPSQWAPGSVRELLLQNLDASFGRSRPEFASPLEFEVSRLRARRVAEHYVDWLFEEAADAPFEVVELEARHSYAAGGYEFVGFIDRVDRPVGGGPVTIFDYKTGHIESDAGEYLSKVRSGEEGQLALYYAMRRAQGEDVARIALVSIRDSRESIWSLALDICDDAGVAVTPRHDREGVVRATCTPSDMRASLDALVARCDLLTRDGVDHFDAGPDPPCTYCAYAIACRERPSDGERIFAR